MSIFARIGALVAVALMFAAASPANAGECGYANCWGAVGIGPGGALGFSHSYPSEQQAVDVAQSGCQGNCDNIRTFYNTCGAMASGYNSAWGFGWADTRAQAESNALGFCREHGSNCSIRAWACSP